MLRTDAGTSDTPRPAATKLTSVAVSATSCAATRLEAVRGARVLDGVVDDRAEVRRVGHERLVGELLERDGVDRGERVRLRAARRSSGSERTTSVHELALADRRAEQAEVEPAVEQARDLGRRQQLAAQVEHDAGQLAAQRGGERGSSA